VPGSADPEILRMQVFFLINLFFFRLFFFLLLALWHALDQHLLVHRLCFLCIGLVSTIARFSWVKRFKHKHKRPYAPTPTYADTYSSMRTHI
jgi:hypothetical protein